MAYIRKKPIYRKCSICDSEIEVKRDENGKLIDSYYFGKMKMPYGEGTYVKIGVNKDMGFPIDVVKWTGKEKYFEYWECKKCFEVREESELENKIRDI